jgi:hypothetical protein
LNSRSSRRVLSKNLGLSSYRNASTKHGGAPCLGPRSAAGSGRSRAQPHDVGAARTTKTPRQPDAACAQAATNGSPLPRVLFPGPSSFRAGKQDAAPHRSKSNRRDALSRARRVGCSASQPAKRNRKAVSNEGTSVRCLRVACSKRKNRGSKKPKRRDECRVILTDRTGQRN